MRENVDKLFQPPHAFADVKQETEVAENLKLLADFIFDVAIVGIQTLLFSNREC